MSTTFPSSVKCCATCANWGGPRKVHYSGSAEVNQPSDRGKCAYGIGNVIPGPCAFSSGMGCPKYQRWSALR